MNQDFILKEDIKTVSKSGVAFLFRCCGEENYEVKGLTIKYRWRCSIIFSFKN
jgi:hypothetical protein